MTDKSHIRQSYTLLAWLGSGSVFLLLCAIAFLVWREQIKHQQALLRQLVEVTCQQAARRLEVFMTFHQRVASLFAHRWASHERRDFSAPRFVEFAGVLRQEMPGYRALTILDAELRPVHRLPPADDSLAAGLAPELEEIFQKARRERAAALSAPFPLAGGGQSIMMVLPLVRGEEFLGYFAAEFLAVTLMDDCFHQRIRAVFHFRVMDGEREIFSYLHGSTVPPREQSAVSAVANVQAVDRRWRLEMTPRPEMAAAYGWKAGLAVPLLGVSFSLGFALVLHLLIRRMGMLRLSRDRQVQLARKILAAQEEERARISRELHDELGQQLTALRLEMGWLQKKLDPESKSEDLFRNAVLLMGQATEELRRMCRGLRPPALDDLGLEPAARSLVEDFRLRSGCQVEAHLEIAGQRLPPPLALCAYRILQEALNNVTRHAQARQVDIRLAAKAGWLELEISDDGRGFDTGKLGSQRGWGLQGMQERASLAGGRLEVASAPGRGTHLSFRAPVGGVQEDL